MVILIDAMFTLVTPMAGLDRYSIQQVLIKKHTGVDVPVEDVRRVYDLKRAEWEHKLPPNHGEKWSIINREILLELIPSLTREEAHEIGTAENLEFLTR